MSYQCWFSVGDHGSSSDELNLLDGVNYAVDRPGVQLEPLVRGARRALKVPLIVYGSSQSALWDNVRNLEKKLTQARNTAGAWGNGSNVTLGLQRGTARMTYYDIWDGGLDLSQVGQNDPLATAGGGFALSGVVLNLSAQPLGRGASVALGTYSITNGTAGTIYLSGLDCDTDSPVTLSLVDTSTGGAVINGVHLARMARSSMASNDFVPVNEVVASGGGSPFSVATASGGSCARAAAPQLTSGQTIAPWVEIGRVTRSGVRTTGLFDLYLRARDNGGLVGTPTGVGLKVANINRVQEVEYNNFSNTSVTQNWPPAWPLPTTVGNTPMMFCSQPYSSGGTYSAWPAVAGWTLLRGNNGLACYYIPNATVQRGPVTLPAVTLDTVVLIEGGGLLSSAADGGANITSGQGTVTTFNANDVVYCWAENVTTANVTATNQTVLINRQGTTGSIALTEKMFNSTGVHLNIGPGGSTGDGIIVTFKGSASSNGTAPVATYTTRVAAVVNGSVSAASAPISITPTTCAGVAGCSWTTTWTAPSPLPAGTTYYVYWSNDGGTTWHAIPTSSTSFTFSYADGTSPGAGTILPSSIPLTPRNQGNWPAEFRAGIGLKSGTVVQWFPAVTSALANGIWEDICLGTASLPPQVPPEGGGALDWVVIIQGRSQDSFAQNLDLDLLTLFPHMESSSRMRFQDSSGNQGTLATARTWEIASSRWGVHSRVTLRDGSGNEVGSVVPSGPFYLGRGDNLITIKLLGANLASDVVNLKANVTLSYEPRTTFLFGD